MFLTRDTRKYTALSFATFSSALHQLRFNGLYKNKLSLTFLQYFKLVLRHRVVFFDKFVIQDVFFRCFSVNAKSLQLSLWNLSESDGLVFLVYRLLRYGQLTSQTESCAWCAPRARETNLEVRSSQFLGYLRVDSAWKVVFFWKWKWTNEPNFYWGPPTVIFKSLELRPDQFPIPNCRWLQWLQAPFIIRPSHHKKRPLSQGQQGGNLKLWQQQRI